MRVLFLNHTSVMSGSEYCLLDLLAELDNDVEPVVACPPGPLLDAAKKMGVATETIAGTRGSLRLHPVHTPRALAELAVAAVGVRRLAARHGIDLVHANTLRSCLSAAAARRIGGPPVAGFIHDILPAGRASQLITRVVRAECSILFANSACTADRFGIASDDPRRRVVYNPIDLRRFDPGLHPRQSAREQLGLSGDEPVLAVVAQITPWKGQREALETLETLRSTVPSARLLVVGDTKFVARATRYDNRAYMTELRDFVAQHGLEQHVLWLGERTDVPAILAAVDILLVPSWEEPFGRIVAEGMAMGCLVAATEAGGPSEIISDGVDGLLLPPRKPRQWADALAGTLARPDRLTAMRRAAPQAAARFDRPNFASAVASAYHAALA